MALTKAEAFGVAEHLRSHDPIEPQLEQAEADDQSTAARWANPAPRC
ncbi:MAG: hypothetical protein U1E90_04220 [Burkholderiaceae bacterium]